MACYWWLASSGKQIQIYEPIVLVKTVSIWLFLYLLSQISNGFNLRFVLFVVIKHFHSFSALYSNIYFLILPGDTDVVPGGNLYFTCKAGGDPPPRLFWRKNGVTLDLDNRRSGSTMRERRLVDGSSRLHIYQVKISILKLSTLYERRVAFILKNFMQNFVLACYYFCHRHRKTM